MTIIRHEHNKQNPYVIINKSVLEDHELSWGAKGLLSYLVSKPYDWEIRVSHLSKIYGARGGGERAIYTLLNELMEAGYCIRSQSRDMDGKFEKVEYIIHEFKNKGPVDFKSDAGVEESKNYETKNMTIPSTYDFQPKSSQPNTRQSDAYTNNRYRLIKEQQQEPLPPDPHIHQPSDQVVVSSSKEISTQQSSDDKITLRMTCLEPVTSLTLQQRTSICSLFTSSQIKKAVKAYLPQANNVKCAAAWLKRAIIDNYEPPLDKNEIFEENKAFSFHIGPTLKSSNSYIEVLNKGVEFGVHGAQMPPHVLEYQHTNFKVEFKKLMTQYKF